MIKYLKGREELTDQIAHHLFSAQRWEYADAIHHHILEGETVILQRYVATGWAYTMAHGRLDQEWCAQFDVGLLKPDLTIYMEREAPLDPEPTWEDPDIYETPAMQKEIVKCFQKIRQPDWLSINICRMTPKMALDQVLPVILSKIEDCSLNKRKCLYY